MSSSLQPHKLQHTRPPCPSPSPVVCQSSCLLHQWCCPATSSSDALSSFCPQPFPASGTFLMSHLFTSDWIRVDPKSLSWAPKSLQVVPAAMKLRLLILGRKAMTNLDRILKSRDVTLPSVPVVKVMVFPVVMYTKKLMPSNCGAGEDSWKSLGQQGEQTSQSYGRSTLNIYWKD